MSIFHANFQRCAIAVCTLALASAAYAGTVEVTPSNMNGWSFWSLNGAYTGPQPGSIGQMVTGPATPPLGIGSAQLSTAPGGGDGGVGITTGAYDGTKLSAISSSLSYSTYVTANNGQQFPYMALNVNLNTGGVAGSGGQDTLFFEPPYQTPGAGGPSVVNQGATVMNKWQSWNASEGGWWDNNDVLGTGGFDQVGSLAAFLAIYPDATIADSDAPFSFIDGVTLQVGFASSGDNFNGYVDNATIGSTTFDFDPNATVPDNSTTIVLLLGSFLTLAGVRQFRQKNA